MQRLLDEREAARIDGRLHDNALLRACRQVWPERQEEIASVTARAEDVFCEAAWLMDEMADADTGTDVGALARGLWSTVVIDIAHWAASVSLSDRYLAASTVFRLVAAAFSLHWQSWYCDTLRDALLAIVGEKCPTPQDLHQQQQLQRSQEELTAAVIGCAAMLDPWVNDYLDSPDAWLTDQIESALNPPAEVPIGSAVNPLNDRLDERKIVTALSTIDRNGCQDKQFTLAVKDFFEAIGWLANRKDTDFVAWMKYHQLVIMKGKGLTHTQRNEKTTQLKDSMRSVFQFRNGKGNWEDDATYYLPDRRKINNGL